MMLKARFFESSVNPISLLNFLNIFLISSWKFILVSKIIYRGFWDETCLTGLLLKQMEEWLIFWSLREKTTFWNCLIESGWKLILHWNVQLLIFFKPLFKWIAEVSISGTMDKREVSSAKSLAFIDISSEMPLI